MTASDTRIGLALSGGGFRAALFHIGVLARLAERDLLRWVDVISTVSGGSIIGAYLYLKIKQLLEGRRPDHLQPSRNAYVQLVREVETDFLAAVQKNMRVRTLADRRKNALMLGQKYSSTTRLAELFNEHFFEAVADVPGHILLQDLPIQADPDHSAGSRIPTLILNATALNTGHLWQLTGTSVGELPLQYDVDNPTMPLLEKLYFADPKLTPRQRTRLRTLTLGQAVAASCCVPGLLEPLRLEGLYQTDAGEDVTLSLVDGGVFDNQGLVSLLAEQCTHIICSDASDLLKWQATSSDRLLNIAMRANEIMMDRIRTKLLGELFERNSGRYAFFHLGDEVGQRIFPHDAHRFFHALSHIRTDLDSFTELEAYTLMYYGYRLSGEKLSGFRADPVAGTPPLTPGGGWNFLAIPTLAGDEQQRRRLLLHLEVGSKQFFKVFLLNKSLPYLIALTPLFLQIALIALALYLLPPLPPVPPLVWVLLAVIVLSIVAYSQNARINQFIDRVPRLRLLRGRLAIAMRPLGIPALAGLTAAVFAWIQLRIFDRLFLRYGRLNPDRKRPKAGRKAP